MKQNFEPRNRFFHRISFLPFDKILKQVEQFNVSTTKAGLKNRTSILKSHLENLDPINSWELVLTRFQSNHHQDKQNFIYNFMSCLPILDRFDKLEELNESFNNFLAGKIIFDHLQNIDAALPRSRTYLFKKLLCLLILENEYQWLEYSNEDSYKEFLEEIKSLMIPISRGEIIDLSILVDALLIDFKSKEHQQTAFCTDCNGNSSQPNTSELDLENGLIRSIDVELPQRMIKALERISQQLNEYKEQLETVFECVIA